MAICVNPAVAAVFSHRPFPAGEVVRCPQAIRMSPRTTPFYLQFEKVEAQFEKAEVQFEKGEAQFEKDEVQFEKPEIQFEKDETQIEKDKVGFEITKIQFEKIDITPFETPLGNYGMNIPACAYQPCL